MYADTAVAYAVLREAPIRCCWTEAVAGKCSSSCVDTELLSRDLFADNFVLLPMAARWEIGYGFKQASQRLAGLCLSGRGLWSNLSCREQMFRHCWLKRVAWRHATLSGRQVSTLQPLRVSGANLLPSPRIYSFQNARQLHARKTHI